jgi:hypothetical protein
LKGFGLFLFCGKLNQKTPMDKIIEILKQLGIDDQSIILKLMILGVIIPVVFTLIKLAWKGIQLMILHRNQKMLNRDLSPFFSDGDVRKATQFYIPTKFQNVSPSEDDEPSSKFIASAKQKIIPLFLKKVFKSDGDDNKFYLILADSGMGKTTFMINLFLAYKNQWTWFGLKPHHKIELFPLGSPDALDAVAKVEDKKNTILLLDAFDEDIKAVSDHKARMQDILWVTKEFREVVITCRTQFFPSEEEVPTEAGYVKTYGDSGTEYKFQKLYLSVFDDKDITRYLRKRFSILQFGNRKKAKVIVKKSPNLVMRPMLLSYINDLVGEERDFTYSFEVYEVLIQKWIERESKKHGVREKYGSAENYQKLLYEFSQEFAVNLYQNKDKRGGYFINHDEILSTQLQFSEVEKYEGADKDLKGKSLLNRNAEGKFKFAHKSIFEYFLAKRCVENKYFFQTFNFEGMSAAENFYYGMITLNLGNLDGTFVCNTFDYRNKEMPLYKLLITDLKDLYRIKITSVENLNIDFLSRMVSLKELVVFDKKRMSQLYDIYVFWDSQKLLERQELQKSPKLREQLELRELQELREQRELLERRELRELLEWRKRLERLGRLELRELRELLERVEVRELPELLELRELRKLLEWERRINELESLKMREIREMQEWQEWRERIELRQWQQWQERLELRELLELMFYKSEEELLKELTPINDFLKEMRELKRNLPNCKIYY